MINYELIFICLFVFSIISSIFYSVLIIKYKKGWDNLDIKIPVLSVFPKVSVVIACRNEEATVENLIKSLISQTYPKEKCEFILVDDFSTDNTINVLTKYDDAITVLSSLKPGKKNAIGFGVENANGDFILTTDADCIVPEKWVESHIAIFIEKGSHLNLAPVDFITKHSIQNILTLEFYSLIGSAGGATAIGKPVLSNAANMAFSKKIYLQLKNTLNKTIPSGDDVFLLQEIKNTHAGKIAFIKSKECIVKTTPPQSIAEFFNQRIRWASKNKYYTDRDIISTGIIIFSVNILMFISLILCVFKLKFVLIYSFLFFTKSIVDFKFLKDITEFFDKKKLLRFFLPVQILYPIYVAIIGVLSFFVKYEWKGRKS